ncbi:MAG: 30S ribosomal protein S17 [Candidatus Melainabacteria bacterium]
MPRKQKIGKVVSNKMDKTIVVSIEEKKPHPKYGKIQIRHKKFKAHDADNICQEGDIVSIEETSPYSKEKCWRLISVLQKAPQEIAL